MTIRRIEVAYAWRMVSIFHGPFARTYRNVTLPSLRRLGAVLKSGDHRFACVHRNDLRLTYSFVEVVTNRQPDRANTTSTVA